MNKPKIEFFNSHQGSPELDAIIFSYRCSSIPIQESDCLCGSQSLLLGNNELPSIAVIHPSYESKTCLEAIKDVTKKYPQTDFNIAILTTDDPTIETIMEKIGTGDNITYLVGQEWRPQLKRKDTKYAVDTLYDMMSDLFQKKKSK